MKAFRYRLEALFARFIYALFGALPLPIASAIGGAIAKAIGPHVRVHRVAEVNLQRAMPNCSEAERREILAGMWDNLGRVFCEYPHLNSNTMLQRVEAVEGLEHLQAARETGRPVFIISGHLGNWELPPVVSAQQGFPLHLLYRAANNPAVDALIGNVRKPYTLGLHDKGGRAARAIVRAMQQGEPVAMLIDQKTNGGVSVPFFGEEAMTSDVLAHLVRKYQPVVLPSYCVRTAGCRFRICVEAPMEFELSGNEMADTKHIMMRVHEALERWIKDDPSQWFWVHKRWPFSAKRGKR